MGVEVGVARSGTSSGRWAVAARPTSVDSRSIVIARSCSSRSGLLPTAARTWNESVDSSYSMIDPPSVPVSRTAIADDCVVENLVEVEARADGLAHLAERLQLRDLAGQLRAPGLQCAHQVDLSQHDRSLNGELLEELAFTVVEGRDVGPPHGQHADDLVLQDHRRGEQRAEPGQALEVVAPVVRVVRARQESGWVRIVLGRAPDDGRTVPGDRLVQQVACGTPSGSRRRLARGGTRRRRGGTAGRPALRTGARRTRGWCPGPPRVWRRRRPSAARISRLAADCSRASRSARCSSFEARDTRVVRSLRSPTVASPGPV